MMDVATNTCYVYRHIRLDKNEPFYVGIGSDKYYYRAYQSKPKTRSQYWNKIAAKTDYEVEIIMDGLSWEEAIKKEIEFISLYGRLNTKTGILCNLTDGGEGSKGYVPTKETLEKRKLIVRTPFSKETLKKNAISHWKKVVQLDKDYNIVKIWDSVQSTKEGGFYSPKIGRCCNYNVRQHKGYFWKFLCNLYDNKSYVPIKSTKPRKPKPKGMKHTEEAKLKNKIAHAIPIIQMTREGEFIKEWLCAYDAGRELFGGTGFSKINDCCRGTRKTHKNFTWKYKNI